MTHFYESYARRHFRKDAQWPMQDVILEKTRSGRYRQTHSLADIIYKTFTVSSEGFYIIPFKKTGRCIVL